jgi:hypothetical protein
MLAAQTQVDTLSFWPKFRVTFGPALVGLLGGALTLSFNYAMLQPVLRACANTYSAFPSVTPSCLACDLPLSNSMILPLLLLGMAMPFLLGLVASHLARPKDSWQAVSAGLTTAATASATAYVLWIGMAVNIAMVTAPSVSDTQLLASATRTATDATAHPTDALVKQYPDLQSTPGDKRGDLLFSKIIADQVVSSAFGVGYGVLFSGLLIGIPVLCGTVAGSWLLKRSGSRCSKFCLYLELTAATSIPCMLVFAVLTNEFLLVGTANSLAGPSASSLLGYPAGNPIIWVRLVALGLISGAIIVGVVHRWNWPIRLVMALTWFIAFVGIGINGREPGLMAYVAYAAYAGLAFLLVQKWFSRYATAPVATGTDAIVPA